MGLPINGIYGLTSRSKLDHRLNNLRFRLQPILELPDHIVKRSPVRDIAVNVNVPGTDNFKHLFEVLSGRVAAPHQRQLSFVKFGIMELDIGTDQPDVY